MNQETINKYFGTSWKPDYSKFKYTGWSLVNKIEPHETIIDIGCGYNLFKPYFGDRLYGIDPADIEGVDEVASIDDFESDNQWDVAFCLGSLNFGTEDIVKRQTIKMLQLVKPGGRVYWRQNPGIGDHPWKGVEDIKFFPWTVELNYQWAEELGCKVLECKWDLNNRIYAEWIKNA